jgi:hypothetical protein
VLRHEKRAKKRNVADVVDRFQVRVIRQSNDRIGRRWSAELVRRDEEAGDRTADEARGQPSVAAAMPTSSTLARPKRRRGAPATMRSG